ncbi:unnamed protein product, partial [Ostreobium quekettii]
AERDIEGYVDLFDSSLREKTFPFWLDNAVDTENGGYIILPSFPDLEGEKVVPDPLVKTIVYHMRMMYGFSLAHASGYSTPERDYLQAAKHGYDFIVENFLDPEFGGYYWAVDLSEDGNSTDTRKFMHAQAFIIFSFLEYYRASGANDPCGRGREAVSVSPAMPVWDFEEDWTPIGEPQAMGPLGTFGLKTSSPQLHLFEAFTELLVETGDDDVRGALQEVIDTNLQYFHPENPGESTSSWTWNWTLVDESPNESYGTLAEIAYLFIRAQKALGEEPDLDMYDAYLSYAIESGYDQESEVGGLFDRGDKTWWANAEFLSSLAEYFETAGDDLYEDVLLSHLRFIECYAMDAEDGIWAWSLNGDGSVKQLDKVNMWKAAYHDVRALLKFIAAYSK